MIVNAACWSWKGQSTSEWEGKWLRFIGRWGEVKGGEDLRLTISKGSAREEGREGRYSCEADCFSFPLFVPLCWCCWYNWVIPHTEGLPRGGLLAYGTFPYVPNFHVVIFDLCTTFYAKRSVVSITAHLWWYFFTAMAVGMVITPLRSEETYCWIFQHPVGVSFI